MKCVTLVGECGHCGGLGESVDNADLMSIHFDSKQSWDPVDLLLVTSHYLCLHVEGGVTSVRSGLLVGGKDPLGKYLFYK